MSLIAFVNKNTFEIKDELDEYIYCDYEIRKVIAALNQKGYKTLYSCAGHNEVGMMWPTQKEKIEKLEEYLEDSKQDCLLKFIEKNHDYFYYKNEKSSTYTYIFFDNKYDFEIYPRNFIYKIVDGKSYLYKQIKFYKDEKHELRKTDKEIYGELQKTHNDLETWVEELPPINTHNNNR